jgi:DNA repair protein RadC
MRNRKSEWSVSEVEISYTPPKHYATINCSSMANAVFRQIWDLSLLSVQEQFYVLFLNQANNVLCWRLIGTGNGKSCIVDNKLLVAIACKTLAQNVIVAHNHPSGNLKPSKSDKQLTNGIQEILYMLDIKLLDHLIISHNGYFSFVDNDMIMNAHAYNCSTAT